MDKDAIWGDYLCGKEHSITTTVSHPGHLNFLPVVPRDVPIADAAQGTKRTSSDDASVLALASAATAAAARGYSLQEKNNPLAAASSSVGSNKRRVASGEYGGESKSS